MPEITDVAIDFDGVIRAGNLHNFCNTICFSQEEWKPLVSVYKKGSQVGLSADECKVQHETVQGEMQKNFETLWEELKRIDQNQDGRFLNPTGSKEEWKNIFTTLIDQGFRVSIPSFTAYGPLISFYLRDVIGLSDDYLQKMKINAWMPADPNSDNKNNHIDQILGCKPEERAEVYQRVILIDDGRKNVAGMDQVFQNTEHTIQLESDSEQNPKVVKEQLEKRLGIQFNPAEKKQESVIEAAPSVEELSMQPKTEQPQGAVKEGLFIIMLVYPPPKAVAWAVGYA